MKNGNAPAESSLLSLPMMAVMTAQFLSAFGDNALLIAAIALLKSQNDANLVPWLQESFIVPYILLAPFAGPIADSFPKGRVMFGSNALKLAGTALIVAGIHPLSGYALVGVGAAIYSPAKYGILTQLFDTTKLVRANGLLEGSTIAAILLGTVSGGELADHSVTLALLAVVILYVSAAAVNLLIPRLPPEHPLSQFRPSLLVRDFFSALAALTADRDARFSLIGTSVFWGAGAALRLLLFAWVPVALGIADNKTPSYLMAALSIGIVFGALAAGGFVTLVRVNRALFGGLLLGPLILAFAYSSGIAPAAVLLISIGICGGIFAVPLNALLQERGHQSTGAGHAVAAQNLFENLSMLLFVGLYAGMQASLMTAITSVAAFGGLLLAGLTALSLWRLKRR
ncbi:MAG TPA: lysophospholipid transporter LplT [Burkholderiales bacterium]|nr:lysophospholipid transporter LplT [Burkholderiales bacterium]